MRAVHGIRMLPMIWYVRRVEKACALRIGMILECNYSDVRRRRVWQAILLYFIYVVYFYLVLSLSPPGLLASKRA